MPKSVTPSTWSSACSCSPTLPPRGWQRMRQRQAMCSSWSVARGDAILGSHARTAHTSTHTHTCGQTRTACAHFVQLCASEHQLFHSIFSAAARGGAGSAASSNYKDEESTGLRCDNRAAHGYASHTTGSVVTHGPLPPSLPHDTLQKDAG